MTTLSGQLQRAIAATLLFATAARVAAGVAPPPASAEDIMQRARQQIAGMSQDLHQESDRNAPARGKTLASTLQQRLDRRFAEAHAAVRPKWYQAARIEELPPVGDGGVRVYRIVTGVVTYCMTYRQDGKGPTYSLCD